MLIPVLVLLCMQRRRSTVADFEVLISVWHTGLVHGCGISDLQQAHWGEDLVALLHPVTLIRFSERKEKKLRRNHKWLTIDLFFQRNRILLQRILNSLSTRSCNGFKQRKMVSICDITEYYDGEKGTQACERPIMSMICSFCHFLPIDKQLHLMKQFNMRKRTC